MYWPLGFEGIGDERAYPGYEGYGEEPEAPPPVKKKHSTGGGGWYSGAGWSPPPDVASAVFGRTERAKEEVAVAPRRPVRFRLPISMSTKMFGLAALTALVKSDRDNLADLWTETRRINRTLQITTRVLGIDDD